MGSEENRDMELDILNKHDDSKTIKEYNNWKYSVRSYSILNRKAYGGPESDTLSHKSQSMRNNARRFHTEGKQATLFRWIK